MYSPVPLPPIDTLNSHAGFGVLLIPLLLSWATITFICLLATEEEIAIKISKFIGVCCLAVAVYAGYVSWTTGTITLQKNQIVTGRFVGYVAEGYSTSERVGKKTKDIEHHYTYVVYSVEGNRVMFRTEPGTAWPEKAILYKN